MRTTCRSRKSGPYAGSLWILGFAAACFLATRPMQVLGSTGAMAVAQGGDTSWALTVGARVWAWGDNTCGLLSDGTSDLDPHPTPVQIADLTNITAVAGGATHSLATASDGTVWAWGSNAYGQLGDRTTNDRFTPVQVAGLAGTRLLAAGSSQSLALKLDGTVWAWGSNACGQLGNGVFGGYSMVPAPVSSLRDMICVTSGGWHNLAVKTDGTVWAWGNNSDGQLGDGTFCSRAEPVQVLELSNVKAVAAGSTHSLALKSDGTVWIWGRDGSSCITCPSCCTPVQVPGLTGVDAVAAGAAHSLALRLDGTVWAWGRNDFGQLGDGTTLTKCVPVKVAELTAVSAVAAGARSNLALKSDGSVWAWGRNVCGQLGDGTTIDRHIPVNVLGLPAAPVIAGIPDVSVQAPQAYTGPTPALVQGSLPVTWSLLTAPPGMTIDPQTGVVSWPVTTVAGSPFSITIRATNTAGSGTQTWRLIVTSGGAGVAIADIPDATIPISVPYTGPTPSLVQGTLPVTWSLVTGPSGMTIDAMTGVVSWPEPVTTPTPRLVAIMATNKWGSATRTWHLTVTPPESPMIAAIPDASVQASTVYVGSKPSLLHGTLPLLWTLVDGPSGMTINPDTGVVSWLAPNTAGSSFPITIMATNSVGSATQTWHLTVTPAGGGVTADMCTLRILTTGGIHAPAPVSYGRGASAQVYAPGSPLGYRFSHWSGDSNGPGNPITLLMDRDKTVTANYVEDEPLTTLPSASGLCGAGLAPAAMVPLLGLTLMRTRRGHAL